MAVSLSRLAFECDIGEVGAKSVRNELRNIPPSLLPATCAGICGVLPGVSAALVGVILVDEDGQMLDAGQRRKIREIAGVDQRPRGLQLRALVLDARGGRGDRL